MLGHSPPMLEAALVLLAFFLLKRLLRSRGPPLPPGPRPWLGALALPSGSDKEWCIYDKWAKNWGDITSITVFGQPVVVLSSFEVAREMFEQKGSVYSDRPVFQMCGELVGWSKSLVLQSYGTPQFKRSRKYLHRFLGSHTGLTKLYPITVDECRKFLQQLLQSPEQFLSHIHQASGAIVLRIAYGYPVQLEDDPIVALVNGVMDEFSVATAPGAFLVDLLPILKYVPAWIPGAGFQRKAKAWANHLSEMVERPFQLVKDQLAQGTAQDSFVSLLLQEDLSAEEITDVKWTASGIYGGGTHTTASTLSVFFLMMARNPEVQAKAQAELDAVVGNRRLPTYADREHLPYVDALCKEVFRYHPVATMGGPRRVMEDDIHGGFFIPKGSIVFPNIWYMAHDPEVYTKPMAFDPLRFIASEGHVPERDPRDFVFGFGRRCAVPRRSSRGKLYDPSTASVQVRSDLFLFEVLANRSGKLLADASVFLACAMTLATFTISKAIKDGAPIEPVEDYHPGSISRPAAFLCSIKPRSAEAAALIS
ncbi:cytochrome P450 [Mycena latifolia]|nr:cytochrome P450 [Mycena latifolia]